MKRAWFTLTVIAVVLWCLGPFLWQVLTSLKPDAEITRLPPLLPLSPTLAHYAAVLRGPLF